jgi:bifunctional non-homologous end joining protein LigD
MLATLVSSIPSNQADFGFEYKWDGVRALAYFDGRSLVLESRNLIDITMRYPELSGLGEQLGRPAVLDGEIIGLDAAGRVSFGALQHRMHLSRAADVVRAARQVPVAYMIFDVLHLGEHSLMDVSYRLRRQVLEGLGLDGPSWKIALGCEGDGDAILESARENQLEGIMAKRLDSPYLPGQRTDLWLKIKLVRRQEFVIGGWLPMIGRSDMVGSLLVGYHEDGGGALRYAGNVGTGFSDLQRAELKRMLEGAARAGSPFHDRLPGTQRQARFCEPKFVGEVAFTEWTADGHIRHPSFKGLRTDKDAGEVVREEK